MDPRSAEATAEFLMGKHGLDGWSFAWDRSLRRFGCCHYDSRTITLNRGMVQVNDVEAVVNVILHEIAHARVGASHGHDGVWRAFARSIGCTGDTCYSDETTVRLVGAWSLTCTRCGEQVPRYREPKFKTYTHVGCGGKMQAAKR